MSNTLVVPSPSVSDPENGVMRDTLVVLEQQALMREALVAMLSPMLGSIVVQGAGSMAQALPMLVSAPECVLLMNVDNCDPEQGLDAVRARFPSVRIVALAAVETRDGVLRCLAAGAHGFVAKSAGAAELVRAVQIVAADGVYVPAGLASPESGPTGPVPPASRSVGPVVDQLTGRQRDVLLLMAEGRSTKDIARTLDLAVSTIKVHLAGVYRTVGARNRVEALCRAGLLPQKLAA